MKAQDVLPPFLDASHRHTAALADFRTQLRKEWTSPPVSRDKSHRWWSAPDVIEDRKKKIKRINGIAWEHNMALPEKITFRSAWKQDVRLDRELEKVYEEFPPVSK